MFVVREQRELDYKAIFIYVGGNGRQAGLCSRSQMLSNDILRLMEARGLLLHSKGVYLIVTRMLGQIQGQTMDDCQWTKVAQDHFDSYLFTIS